MLNASSNRGKKYKGIGQIGFLFCILLLAVCGTAFADNNKVVYDHPGVYGPTSGIQTMNNDVVIESGGITLQNVAINGKLTIQKSASDGVVTLSHVTVSKEVKVDVKKPVVLNITGATLNDFVMDKHSDGSTVLVDAGTTIEKMDLYSAISVNGSGTIKSAMIYKDGALSTFQRHPVQICRHGNNGNGQGGGVTCNSQPEAKNVSLSGVPEVGKSLSASYTYYDVDGDLQGASVKMWYASDDATGTNKTLIAGASGSVYTPSVLQLGKYISFEVIPFALSGISDGDAVESQRIGPVQPDSVPPGPIMGLISSNLTSTGLKLTWSPSSDNVGVTQYLISRGYNKYGTTVGTITNVANVTYTQVDISGLLSGTAYTFFVSAVDAAGNEGEKSKLTVTTITASGLPWRSGYLGVTQGHEGQFTDFGNWRGRPADLTVLYIGGTYKNLWSSMLNNPPALVEGGNLQKMTDNNHLVTFSMPLVAKESQGQFHNLATGAFDAYHQQLANRIHEIVGDRPIYIRLGWEANRGYEWSFENNGGLAVADDYKQGWARIANIYKQTIPNARMIWNLLRNVVLPVDAFYPGDDVVDVLGMDPYDNGANMLADGNFADSEADWIKFCGSYNTTTGILSGPCGLAEYANLKGKKISFEEWGATNKSGNTDTLIEDGSNNAYYTLKMFQYFQQHNDMLEFELYFNSAQPVHQLFPVFPEFNKVSQSYINVYHPNPQQVLLSNVTGFRASNVMATGLTLNWTPPQDMVGVQGFKILRGSTQIGTASATSSSFVVTGLNASTSYSFSITPFDANSNFRPKSTITVSTVSP